MPFILTILLSLFPALLFANFNGAQTKGRDTTRKNDINSTYQKLEEHYNEYGYYPTASAVQSNGLNIFPGIDQEALIDVDGKTINDYGSEYTYSPEDCDLIGCQYYTLKARLEDGTEYQKQSLN